MSFIDRLEKSDVTTCHFCQSRKFKKLWDKDGFTYLKCLNCQIIFVTPLLKKESIDEIHSIGHPHKKKQDILKYNYKNYKKALFKKMNTYHKIGRLLDIGCGKGYFIASARENGWESIGIDLSPFDIKFATEELNQKAISGELFSANFPDNYFDVITLFDTIEHLRDPALYLKEIFRILRPGGLLYLETPNFNSFPRRLWNRRWSVFFPWHFYYFTPKTLKNILSQFGFKIKYLLTWSISPFDCKDTVKNLERVAGLTHNSNHSDVSKDKMIKKKSINKVIFSIYNWIRSAERSFFIILKKCHLNLGTKIELWAEKTV